MGKGSTPLYHGVGCLSGDPDPLETLGLRLLGKRGSLVPGLAHGSTEVARWLCSCPQEHQRSQGWGSIRTCGEGGEDSGKGLGLLEAVQETWRRGQAEKQSWYLWNSTTLLSPGTFS